jgi:Lrp/AsnC family leucine-responsive transcriptional regulator
MTTQRFVPRSGQDVPGVAEARNDRRLLDDTDRAILRVLRDEARITNRALAERVNLSAPATLRRVRRLEGQGVIRRYTIDVDADAAGPGLVAYVGVRISEHARSVVVAFKQSIKRIESVSQACAITGEFDYLLRVEVDDLAGYRHFHSHELAGLPGVVQVTTFVVIEDLGIVR